MSIRIMFLCGIFAIFIFPSALLAQSQDKIHQQAIVLKRVIELNHYAPKKVDDRFSEQLFDNFLKNLQEDKQLITTIHKKELLSFRHLLDDELNGQGWNFFNKVIEMCKTEVKESAPASANNKEQAASYQRLKRILNHPSGFENYIASVYFDALANCFDPHTEYMPREEKQRFESALDTEGYYFGFSLEENDKGDVEISRLKPGSPAWKSGDLNKGDVIVKLAWEGKEPVSLEEVGAEEISELLNGPNSSSLQITVRKADGIEKTTSLVKEKIENEDNHVRSYVLQGTPLVGYIYLPDFYTGHEGSRASCANDVAKEIVKLLKENIQGLVLDLRYNGGGSLQEALDMAGIFIDAGPLSMIKEKTGKIISLKDLNRGTIYDGPLTLMVNSQSASASELLGAVLQDYNRAVIAGSTSFGKGTAQVIFPLDTSNSPMSSGNAEHGFVKITTSKFYRVNGRTTQYAGVAPDVPLPDIFDGLNYHEAALPTALPADTIPKNTYYKPLPILPLSDLAQKSKARVQAHKHFQQIKRYSALLRDTTSSFDPGMLLPMESSNFYRVKLNSFDASMPRNNTYDLELKNNWIERISKDIYIEEAYHIINDLLTLNPH